MKQKDKDKENNKNLNSTIIVVEDNKSLNQLIQRILKKEGYTIKVASTGAEAISLIAENPDAPFLLDYLLPDMTGKDVIKTMPIATKEG